MKSFPLVLLLGSPVLAQTVAEIPAATVVTSVFDLDAQTVGPTTVASIAAACPGLANISFLPMQ